MVSSPSTGLSLHSLPTSLLSAVLSLLLLSQQVHSQASDTTLSLNSSLALNTSSLSSTTYSLPPSNASTSSLRTVSIALCSKPDSSSDSETRYFATNNTAISDPASDDSQSAQYVYEVSVGSKGLGNLTLNFDGVNEADGSGAVGIDAGSATQSFEIGVTDVDEPLHGVLDTLPLLGDTTANQALLFSPPFLSQSVQIPAPTYPNYTLPSANLSAPTQPDASITPNFTLLIASTASGVFPAFNVTAQTFEDGTPFTACALKSLTSSSGNVSVDTGNGVGMVQSQLVLRDTQGWRTEWLIRGLAASTNYTAYVIQEDVKVAGPIYFATKSATFSCPLVHALPFCPSIAYAIPLSFPASSDVYDSTNFPTSISDPIISYISNFSISLATFACGRDEYSPVVSCADCADSYRDWVCAVQIPRCSEMPVNVSTSTSTSTSTGSSTDVAEKEESIGGNTGETRKSRRRSWKRSLLTLIKRDSSDSSQAPILLPALTNTNSSLSSLDPSSDSDSDSSTSTSSSSSTATTAPSRNPNFSTFGSNNGTYTQLLPCLEVCNALERSCPSLLSLACPVPDFDAYRSYGVGYIDGDGSGMAGLRDDGMGNDGSGSGTSSSSAASSSSSGSATGRSLRGPWSKGGGVTGTSQDRFGNVWCNGNVAGLVDERAWT